MELLVLRILRKNKGITLMNRTVIRRKKQRYKESRQDNMNNHNYNYFSFYEQLYIKLVHLEIRTKGPLNIEMS